VLPADEDPVPLLENLFLPVEGQVIAILGQQDLRQQAGCGQLSRKRSFGAERGKKEGAEKSEKSEKSEVSEELKGRF